MCGTYILCMQEASVKDTLDVTASSTEKKPSTKKEPMKAASKISTASSTVTTSKEREKDKKKPLCPYGTKCYRYRKLIV